MIDLETIPRSAFNEAFESNLRRLATPEKALLHFLAAVRQRLGADLAWIYRDVLDAAPGSRTLFDGDRELFDPGLTRAFLRQERPRAPRHIQLAPVRLHDRLVAVAGVARRGAEFALGSARPLNRLAAILADDLVRREDERTLAVLDRIKEKMVGELRPRDLAYQILQGLDQLVQYDHSASLLTYDAEADVFRVEAERVVWTKTKSAFIGHEIDVPDDLLRLLRASPEARVSEADSLVGSLLNYYRGQGIPSAESVVSAPLFFDGEFLGLLKIAYWKRPVAQHDLQIVERFVPAAAVSLRNVRLRQSLENQIVQAEVKAGLVNLTRAVAHDVNNAVGSMLPLAEQAREELTSGAFDAAELARDLDVIIDKARLCKRIFSSMLRVVSQRRGSGPVDANQVVRELAPMLEAQAELKSADIDLRLEDALPAIRFSKSHLERIVWNLVNNALESLAGDGGRVVITTRRAGEDGVVLSVMDNGSGIDPAMIGRVQEPFFTTKHSGTGLGLAICRSLAWEYGGGIKIESLPGRGTDVQVHLLRAADVAEPGPPGEDGPR